ncbi:MAG: phenylacetic acid degradation protein PaaN [Flavobacteriaceae bacterium]|nr:phenylacetic acid degradation protein PaaN [Flavobacteriaceae bacterium]
MNTSLKERLEAAYAAQQSRTYFAAWPESPRAYAEDGMAQGLSAFQSLLTQNFTELLQDGSQGWVGDEVSPYMMTGLGVQYPQFAPEVLIANAKSAQKVWSKTPADVRAAVLLDALDRVALRFFEIAYATMHTTGQSFMMSFQASGPHANDRALEVLSMAYHELHRFPSDVTWVKNMGKFDLTLQKNYKAIPKGVALVIGCSTFPTWNTVPGLFGSLMTGNASIVKPHPKSVLPIAIVVAEMQKAFLAAGLPASVVQLGVDTLDHPITKKLAEDSAIKLIDYTGGSAFGDYIESLQGKTVFTEKAGVNSVILDSVADANAVFGNLAFAASLYSGQMCTAPQNIFVSAEGVKTADGHLSYDDVVAGIANAVKGLAENPKMGAGTLGAIQNDVTSSRVKSVEAAAGSSVALSSMNIVNPEFPDARTASPTVIAVDALDEKSWKHECFGPIVFVVKTDSAAQSLTLTADSAAELGAITCSCYSTDNDLMVEVEDAMNAVFTPVSFNFSGAAFVNQHAAFSDFHVTGGNPSGNASFTDSQYVNRRFVWVGNRKMA